MRRHFSFFVMALALLPLHASTQENSRPVRPWGRVHGSVGSVPSAPHGMMTDAPDIVLAFTAKDAHRAFIATDERGDYEALLGPGHYCLVAYARGTGEKIGLDPRQLKCVDVLVSKDVRLDVMLARKDKEKLLPNQTVQKSKVPRFLPNR